MDFCLLLNKFLVYKLILLGGRLGFISYKKKFIFFNIISLFE